MSNVIYKYQVKTMEKEDALYPHFDVVSWFLQNMKTINILVKDAIGPLSFPNSCRTFGKMFKS